MTKDVEMIKFLAGPGKSMNKLKEQIEDIAFRYGLQIIYAFGSRAKEALDLKSRTLSRLDVTESEDW